MMAMSGWNSVYAAKTLLYGKHYMCMYWQIQQEKLRLPSCQLQAPSMTSSIILTCLADFPAWKPQLHTLKTKETFLSQILYYRS